MKTVEESANKVDSHKNVAPINSVPINSAPINSVLINTAATSKTRLHRETPAKCNKAQVVELFGSSIDKPNSPESRWTNSAKLRRSTNVNNRNQTDQPASCETRYFASLARHSLLNADEEKDLAKRAKIGDIAARNRMIEANLRLVVKVAKSYANRDVPMLDLISEGNLGLIHAIGKFQPEKGFRFSTYAIWWIREKIQAAVMRQSNIAYMPIHAVKAQRACLRAQNELRKVQGSEPSVVDIAAFSGKKRVEVESLLGRIEKISPIDNDEGNTSSRPLRDRLVDNNNIDPAESLANKDMHAALRRSLTQLNVKQRTIVVKRYGLNGKPPASLQALSEELGLCRQTIKKLQDAALSALFQELHH